MYVHDSPIKIVGNVDTDKLNQLFETIKESFNDKWVRRATNVLMDSSYSIKAISPSTYDIPDDHTQIELQKLLLPFVTPYVKENEIVIYLDISSLPPGAKSLVHVDYLLFHVIAKRIRIPITTNPNATISNPIPDAIKAILNAFIAAVAPVTAVVVVTVGSVVKLFTPEAKNK